MSKFGTYYFLILTVINFISILSLYYLYQNKIVAKSSTSSSFEPPQQLPSVAEAVLRRRKQNQQWITVNTTTNGMVAGLKRRFSSSYNVATFVGIPYAPPPIGVEGRFRAPRPLPPLPPSNDDDRITPFEAIHWPNPCLQPDNHLRLKNFNFSEDCLYLNLWSPLNNNNPNKLADGVTEKLKPVMVLIHTGAFIFGSASEETYDGIALAALANVVVVTFNYRLNLYGYLYGGSMEQHGSRSRITPNVGMLDQVAALKWVQTNVAHFGGDPRRVTLIGQSSGGLSVGMHLTSPLSRGMFSRAIIMSGSPLQTAQLTRPSEVLHFWRNYAIHLGCLSPFPLLSDDTLSLSNDTIDCIQSRVEQNRNLLPTMALVKRLSPDSMFVNVPIVVDGHFQPRSQSETLLSDQFELPKNFALLFGYTNDEGSWIAAMENVNRFGPRVTPSISDSEAYQLVEDYVGRMRTTKSVVNITVIHQYYLQHLYNLQSSINSKNNNTDHRKQPLILNRLVSSVLGDHYIVCPANLFANMLLSAGTNQPKQPSIYQYYWQYKGDPRTSMFWNTFTHMWCGSWMGSCHSFEMFAIFGVPFLQPAAFNTADRVVSMKAIQLVSYFAHNGKLFWPQFHHNQTTNKWTKMYFIIDDEMNQYKFGENLKSDVCENIWQNYLL